MTKQKSIKLVLPALRGVMGAWVYYSCLISIQELAKRVNFAGDIHKNKNLSDMIQRALKSKRSADIATYVEKQKERFFNSLVIATYGGRPNWHALSNLKSRETEKDLQDLKDDTIASVGFLTFQGDEKLFALDGQHRLAGIKKAISAGLKQDPYDDISVIFVAHDKSQKGLERTRRLFTTLNKTAKPVSKSDIIALDEDDVMAICVRHLIEETTEFRGNRIAFVAGNNMPSANVESLTTIANLYDLLEILFTKARTDLQKKKTDLTQLRPPDDDLQKYIKQACEYFDLLGKHVPELAAFFSAAKSETVVKKCRGSHGGSLLFRPIGLTIFTQIVAKLSKDNTLAEAVKLAAKLPTDLTKAPYAGLMWDVSSKIIVGTHNTTVRELLLYMLDASSMTDATLLERYRKGTGNDKIKLPSKLV